jgi:hypothetical protein
MLDLVNDLDDGRVALGEEPARVESGCDTAGEARARLYNSGASRGGAAAWVALLDATDALIAACGKSRLLQAPSNGTALVESERAHWKARIRTDLDRVCRSLGEASEALGQPRPSCR